jgi:putative phosphoribosyl transferase
MYFTDRQDAGRRLAAELIRFKDRHPVVLALPRGGVPVGFEIAQALGAPLDLVLVRKIGAPGEAELAIGAIAEGTPPEKILDDRMVVELDIPQSYIDEEVSRQIAEIERRRTVYLGDRVRAKIRGSTAIVVDDGLATGATMRAALRAVRRRHPVMLVLAVPVAPAAAIERLRAEVDEVVCLSTPEDFFAIGQFYLDFRQLEDAAVVALVDAAHAMGAPASPG